MNLPSPVRSGTRWLKAANTSSLNSSWGVDVRIVEDKTVLCTQTEPISQVNTKPMTESITFLGKVVNKSVISDDMRQPSVINRKSLSRIPLLCV